MNDIYSPIQYLGCKIKIVDEIAKAITPYIKKDNFGVDLFSGTAVVSQGLANRSKIIGIDNSLYSKAIFEATVKRNHLMDSITETLIECALPPSLNEKKEEKFLKESDYHSLIKLYKSVNQDFVDNYSTSINWWKSHTNNGLRWIETIYGGHFFSYKQARELSEIRNWIKKYDNNSPILLTALLSAASNLSCSAGKHFASPLNFLSETLPTAFVVKRMSEDRRKSAYAYFFNSIKRLNKLSPMRYSNDSKHMLYDLSGFPKFDDEISFFYADPPYTVDQYSRFYSFLDLIINNSPFVLSVNKEKRPYLGRYSDNRIKSDFSNPIRAPKIFDNLFHNISSYSSPLILSYSQPKENSRSRTVPPEILLSLLNSNFKHVSKVHVLNHSYRPLQPQERKARSSEEILVIAK